MSPVLLPIPQPRTVPLIGNLPGRELVVVSSRELVDELCGETRFDKLLSSSLREVRRFAGDGLFTAETQEPTWGAAHRTLMPAFGPAALRGMAEGMLVTFLIADHATLTVAVQSGPARSGSGLHEGVASTFLAHVRPGTRVTVSVRPSQVAFRPPALDVPVVMVAAGSGIAPFRGFLADRALEADLWADRADVVDLVRGGASFLVCGDGQRMAPAVYATCRSTYAQAIGATPEEADGWLTAMQREHGRYAADVFA